MKLDWVVLRKSEQSNLFHPPLVSCVSLTHFVNCTLTHIVKFSRLINDKLFKY